MRNTHYYFLFFVLIILYACGQSDSGQQTPTVAAPTTQVATNITENSFQANWTLVSGATAYLLYVSTDRNFGSFVSGFNGKSVTSNFAEVTNLTPETEYFYRLKAQNGNTLSEFSAVMAVKTLARTGVALAVPVAQNASQITATGFRANWNAVAGATEYSIDVATNQNFTAFVPSFQDRKVSGLFIDLTGLNPQTAYFYRVKALNATQQSVFSSTVQVTTLANVVTPNFSALETFINSEMSANKINGLAGFIIKNNQVVWKKGFGKANLAENKNVDTETVFMLASVSKTVTGVILMTLFDQGKFKLDEDINKYLPFKVTNPRFPNDIITIRMILTHTSSIQDNSYNAIGDNITYRFGADHPESLATFMKDCLNPDGKYYDAANLFTDKKPGTTTKYSNLSSALCGYLAEVIAGESFHSYSRKVLYTPLGLKNSAWAMRDVNLSNSAIPYQDDNTPIGHYSFVDYPNGGFRTNVEDFSKYLLMVMNGGSLGGVKILERATMAEVLKSQNLGSGEFGLKFTVSSNETGHSGLERGVTAEMYFNPQTGVGVFVTFNKGAADTGTKIYKKMMEEGSK